MNPIIYKLRSDFAPIKFRDVRIRLGNYVENMMMHRLKNKLAVRIGEVLWQAISNKV